MGSMGEYCTVRIRPLHQYCVERVSAGSAGPAVSVRFGGVGRCCAGVDWVGFVDRPSRAEAVPRPEWKFARAERIHRAKRFCGCVRRGGRCSGSRGRGRGSGGGGGGCAW